MGTYSDLIKLQIINIKISRSILNNYYKKAMFNK